MKRILDSSPAKVILAGGAKGVDTYAHRYADVNNIPFVLFKPYFLLDNKATYTPRHYFIRNKQLVDNADYVVAIWDGVSKGTEWGINYAKRTGKRCEVYTLDA